VCGRAGTTLSRVSNLHVDVWSDIACPWCYVGKRRLEAALAAFPHREHVQVRWRAFELDPRAPRARDLPDGYAGRLAAKYGATRAQGDAMVRRMTDVAAAEGLDFRFDRIRPGNTFDAHRLLHAAGEVDLTRQDALKERLMRAYFTDGLAIGDPDALAEVAIDAGLDDALVREVLGGDRFADDVRADEHEAHALGITGVPFFVLGGRLGVSGAQPIEVMGGALAKGWELASTALETFADGAACGPDGCT